MNRYRILIIIFVVLFSKSGYSQSGVKPAGIYEVGDTTIEVYNWKDPYCIREFKIINGTETILYRSFNRLTKKLQEEGTFKGGYSSGVWKFYGWTGRLKKEVSYDNMVKTCYEKKIELRPEELFDFAKFHEDSIFVEKYRKQKLQAANKNIKHDTIYIEKPVVVPTGVTVNIGTPATVTTQPAAVNGTEPGKALPVPAEPVTKGAAPAAIAGQPASVAPGAQSTAVKKDTPTAVATQPATAPKSEPAKPAPVPTGTPATTVKNTEPAKAASTSAQPAPVNAAPAGVAAQPTEAKKAEPAKAASPVAPSAPVKKEVAAAAATPPAAQPAAIKKETPVTPATQPAAVKTTEPAKAASPPAQAPSVKEVPVTGTAQPAAAKAAEPVKAAPVAAQPVPAKKETPAPVAAQPAVKNTEATKAASPAAQPAPVKNETPAAAAAQPSTGKPAEPQKAVAQPAPTPVAAQPTEVKKNQPVKPTAEPAQPTSAKKQAPEKPAPSPPTEIKKKEPVKNSEAVTKPENTKKETIEEDPAKITEEKKYEREVVPVPVKQKKDAAMIEERHNEPAEESSAEVNELVASARDDNQEVQPQPTDAIQEVEINAAPQPKEDNTQAEEVKVATIAEHINKETLASPADSIQQQPAETPKKVEEKSKPLNQNLYYGWRANGNWFEISNFRPHEFLMRYNTQAEDKTRFSFFEFALDSMGKLKKEKIIGQVAELKNQSLLKLQMIDSLALVYGMQAMDKPFSHLLEYSVDSTQINNARFQLYITGMPYNKKTEENKTTEPFDFIVLDPWTGELITKGNGNAVTDNDNELSIRMTTLIRNQDVQ